MSKPKGEGYELICPSCRKAYFDTTKSFRSTIDANAGMFKLKRQYTAEGGGNQWTGFPPDPTAGYGFLECPGCGAAYSPSGRVEVRAQAITPADNMEIEINQAEFVCNTCVREFKNQQALSAHMRVHKNK